MNATLTPGAIRAAKAIEADHQFCRMERQRILDRAAIIDHETAAPETLAALNETAKYLLARNLGTEARRVSDLVCAAIARAEGRTP